MSHQHHSLNEPKDIISGFRLLARTRCARLQIAWYRGFQVDETECSVDNEASRDPHEASSKIIDPGEKL